MFEHLRSRRPFVAGGQFMGLGFIAFPVACAALACLGAVTEAFSGIDTVGDVSVIGTATADADCPECLPSGKGTRLEYEVQLAINAANENGADFHLRVSDQASANFKCFKVEKWNPLAMPPAWEVANGWTGTLVNSQVEGGVNVHYIGWYRLSGDLIKKGDRFRFSVVYCGNARRDSTIEWILTNDGTQAPAVPDAEGDRSDVPDQGGADDPGWLGPTTSNPGTGFAVVADRIPTLPTIAMVILVTGLLVIGCWKLRTWV